MFGNLFKIKAVPKNEVAKAFIVVQLNARLQPMHRAEFFEDPLDDLLTAHGIGEISGGGTLQSKSGEIEFCDIEIEVSNATEQTVQAIIHRLEELGAPKGSKLTIGASDREIAFGASEGMAVYLNGSSLPDEVYRECDSNFVYSEFDRLLNGSGRVLSYWQGPTETACYLCGGSFVEMREKISGFIARYPLCQQCRVVQIA
ncbi:hypothetical protein [Massilia sp. PWRC2]|uniref:hypothetical protein n=1 Tax=Massilia sp. PWRC2 TaxID=2804626 RepID=UPI003CEF94DD